MELEIYTDGASRGNPGHAGIGVVIKDKDGKVLESYGEYIGRSTNNIAEYKALISALRTARKFVPCEVRLFLDSELVVRQVLGQYRTKDEALKAYREFVNQLSGEFERFEINYIPREKNKAADKLANKALDEAAEKKQLAPERQLTFEF